MFKYSERPGTFASKNLPDNVSEEVKIARLNEIIALQNQMSALSNQRDIGKIFEYTIDLESGLIDYDEDFRKEWITHSQYGFSICMNAGFKRIAKMIAAHHARADWGAIVDLDTKDLEPIYYLVHHLDDLSAKFGRTSVNML